ncbi:MAG: ribosome rescue protein RqcH [Ignisphaera sp.]|uniref:Fibronectin-binding domain-containing protein n=1 Tax=Ignisphaera aggregans TaxID=334771 RepID=A0A7J3MZH9_9CREN
MDSAYTHRKKLSMSWLDLKLWLKEQGGIVTHSYIDKLYYIPEGPILLMKLYNSGKSLSFWLIVEPSKRVSVSFSDLAPETYPEPPQKIWRSLLKDCYISDLSQITCERIFYINLNCRSTTRKIVVELLPRGSICVLNEDNRILLCNEYKHMKDRELKPGLIYVPPPLQHFCMNLSEIFYKVGRTTNLDVTRILVRESGVPPEIAETISIQCYVKGKKLGELSDSEIQCLATTYKNIIDAIENSYKACIVYDENGVPIGFYPYIPLQFTNHKIEYYSTLNDAINRYYENEFKEILLTVYSHNLKKEIDSMKKTIDRIDYMVQELRKKSVELEKRLKIIEENYDYFEQLHKCILDKIKSNGWNEILLCGSIHDFSPSSGTYRVKQGEIILELDVRKSFIENYNNLRKSLASIYKSINRAEKEKNDILNRLQELYKQIEYKEKRISYRMKKAKEWYESYIWYITSSGFLVIGGKNASQNMKIIRRLVDSDDIVLHADVHGASTVVIKTYGKSVDYDSIKEASLIAACYSKAWKNKLFSVDVFWVKGSQISLSPPSGEYLQKGSYMIYGERNYLRNIELKLAIGIEIVNENLIRILIGPEDVISKRTIAYFVIIPGDDDPQSIANNFIEFLKSKKLDEIAITVNINEVVDKTPGRSKVVKLVVNYK